MADNVGANKLYPFVLTLVVVGLVLGIGIYVLAVLNVQIKADTTVTNEQITASNNTATQVTYNPIQSVTSMSNATSAVSLNYTFSDAGVIVTDDAYNGETVNISYVGKLNSSASSAVDETIDAIGDIPTWLTIIVVVAMAAIVLMLIMGSFGRQNR